MARWSPLVPGTGVSRLELLKRLVDITDDPASAYPLYRDNYVRELGALDLFTAPQIGHIVGCAPNTVKMLLGRTPHATRGHLPPSALSLMLLVVRQLASGKQPYASDIAVLARNVSPVILTKLVGFSPPTYWRAAHGKRKAA